MCIRDRVATKRYTKARVRRILTYILVGAMDQALPDTCLLYTSNGGSKLAKKERLPRILKIQDKFKDRLAPEELAFVTFSLEEILLKKWSTKEEKAQMKSIREDLIRFVHETGNEKLIKEIEQLVYRPVKMCIRDRSYG